MRLRWTLDAAADFEQIYEYVQINLPHLVTRTILSIYDGIRSLKRSPYLGRPGRAEGTHELVLFPLPYVVIYRIKEQFVEVLHIYHGAQKRP